MRGLIHIDHPTTIQLWQPTAVDIAAFGAGSVPLAAPVTLQHRVPLQLVPVQAAVLNLATENEFMNLMWLIYTPLRHFLFKRIASRRFFMLLLVLLDS
jgi:hypothetical protein